MADEIDGPSTSTTPVPEPTLNTLKYTPLAGNHEFRLLRILPKLTDTPPILCELVTASVADSAGKYIAGSYVWGAPELASSIILNGISFGIRANLAYFLRACRSKYKTRVIWIDAICINQDDMAERSSQVRIMSQIYTGAASVYCWLG
ncbi:HET-domain-containing protein, partial [Dothidotthia symphoricarpi CBS 119687]